MAPPGQLRETPRSLVTASVAGGVHLALFLLALRAHGPTPIRPPPAVVEESLESTESALLDMAESATPRSEGVAALAKAAPERALVVRSATSEPASLEASSTTADPTSTAQPRTESSSTPMLFMPSPGAIGISGDGAINPFLRPGALPEPPPRVAEASPSNDGKRAAEQSLKDAMRARDVGIGLGPEGPILHALQDATYGGLAPDQGKATFLAVVDTNGIVIDLRLLSSHGGESGWADARDRAKRALAGAKMALRGARGAELRIEVESDIRLPSGNRPNAPPVTPQLTPSKIAIESNAPSGGTAGVVQSWTIGSFDVTDIKAKPRRIVHTRLLSMSTL